MTLFHPASVDPIGNPSENARSAGVRGTENCGYAYRRRHQVFAATAWSRHDRTPFK